MLVTVYSGNLTKKTVLNQIVDYRYKRWYYNIGDFELTVLKSDPGEPWYNINPGDILYVYDDENGDDSLYISTVTVEKGRVKFSGYDLKIILNWRITLFPTKELEAGTYGYDCRTGYTGDIIKGYIDYNLCEASDLQRRLSNSYCTAGVALGLSDDTYMSRLQPLNEVIEALCGNAGIGYKVTLDPFSLKYIINIFDGTDRRREMGFGTYIGNADSVKKIRDNTSERTTAWAVNGTGAKDSTVTAVQLSDSIETGIKHKETAVTVNCGTDQVSAYAKHSAGDYRETEEIDASVSVKGMECDVGDIVTVHDDAGGVSDMRIIAIEKEYSGCKLRKMLHFADYQVPKPRKKMLVKLAAAENTAKKDIVDQKLDSGEADTSADTSGVNIANAVVITEADAKNIIHNFTQTEYIAGNKIGYAGSDNQIIINGYIATKLENKESAPVYTAATLKSFSGTTVKTHQLTSELISYGSAGGYTFAIKDNGTPIKQFTTYDSNYMGFVITWRDIYGATSTAVPYGYAYLEIYAIYKSTATATNLTTEFLSNVSRINYIFASEEEYNAAVGLTYEPIILTAVNDNVQLAVNDVLEMHTDGSSVTKTSQLTNDSGFAADEFEGEEVTI